MTQEISIKLPTFGPHVGSDYESGPIYKVCVCGRQIGDDDRMLLLDGKQMHARCFADLVSDTDINNAWVIIAGQIALHPSKFRASEIKAVIYNLLRMIPKETTNSYRLAVGTLLTVGSSEPPDDTTLIWFNSGGFFVEIWDSEFPLSGSWIAALSRCGPFIVGPDIDRLVNGGLEK